MKPLPVSVIVNPGEPALMLLGDIEVRFGCGFDALIVNISVFENVPAGAPCVRIPLAPPPAGNGLNTTTDALPTLAMSAAVIAAVNCVALTNVVVRLLPFHCTTALFSKLLPFTVRVNAAPPAIAEFGTSVDSAATGVVTLKKNVFDVPPPGVGFTTITGTLELKN